MACVTSDGHLTDVALTVLRAVRDAAEPLTADAVARAAGLPLYRARASTRELREAGLLDGDGAYRLSPAGAARLSAGV